MSTEKRVTFNEHGDPKVVITIEGHHDVFRFAWAMRLAQLTAIAKQGGFEPKVPNNVGVIDDIRDDTAYVIFDDCGQCAPYPLADCFRINPHIIPAETGSDAQQYDGADDGS